MANKSKLRISVVEAGLKEHCNAVLNAIDNAAAYAAELTDAQDGDLTNVWGRTLYATANTGKVTLTINATAKTVTCLAGAGLFINFRVGRDVQLALFSNGANNQSTEITAVTEDSITVGNATGLVDETDTASRATENIASDEKDFVDEIIVTKARFTELQSGLDNEVVATADRRDDITNWIW